MPTSDIWFIAADIIALVILASGLFLRRHRRPDMFALLIGLNIGVMAVSIALNSSEIGAGFGFALFGALAIIRLRSDALALAHIAYAFSSLAIGLLAGFRLDPAWLGPALMALIVAGMAVGDWPGLLQSERRVRITLDRAIAGDRELLAAAEKALGRTVDEVSVQEIDLVRDMTCIDARYRLSDSEAAGRRAVASGRRLGRRSAVSLPILDDPPDDAPGLAGS